MEVVISSASSNAGAVSSGMIPIWPSSSGSGDATAQSGERVGSDELTICPAVKDVRRTAREVRDWDREVRLTLASGEDEDEDE